MRLAMIFALSALVALAQHGGTPGGGNVGGHGSSGHGGIGRVPAARARGGFGSRLGVPFLGSYWPQYGDSYDEEPWAPIPQIGPPLRAMAPLPQAQTVIHEYTVPSGDAGSIAPAFTIAMKDGTERHASAAWVQSGKLHYLDLQDRQQALGPDEIDREKTERLTQEKHVRLQLPQG